MGHRNHDNHAAGLIPAPLPPEALGQVGGNNASLPPPTHTARQWPALSVLRHTEGSCACAQGRAHSTRPTQQPLPSLQLGTQKLSQGLEHSPAQLQEQLGATQAQEQQTVQQLSRAKEAIQDLHRKVAELQQQVRARTGMQPQSQTPLLPSGEAQLWPTTLPAPQLCWQEQDVENVQAELAKAWQESTKQVAKIAAYKTHRQQLHQELRKKQSFKEQSKQEVRRSQVFL